ncbi:hypothetical protein ACVWYQ_003244 [Bradyrhizobium sp. USDA 3397]
MDPAGANDVDFGTTMFAADLRQWPADCGGSAASSVSINMSAHGTSREADPLRPPINAFWDWTISAT